MTFLSRVFFIGAAFFFLETAHAQRSSEHPAAPRAQSMRLPPLSNLSPRSAIRGMTVGPIENSYHPGVGYGSEAFRRCLVELKRIGATWLALTPFGRMADLSARGVDPTFETPFARNRQDVARAVAMAHDYGLKVMLVPHLWVERLEPGQWRGQFDPKTNAGWHAWAQSYRSFVLSWATLAERTSVEMFSVGVELRPWVTSTHASSFADVIRAVRASYHGILTYSANWDDAEETVIWGELDVIGVNAFYPLADHEGATLDELRAGGQRVAERARALAQTWQRPILFTELGYTTRPDPAVRPWEWPDSMRRVTIDEAAQARAYRALIAPLLDAPEFLGFFVWRVYSDPDDVSQESEWGFSPRGKLAELVVRDAFAAPWAADDSAVRGWGERALVPGLFP